MAKPVILHPLNFSDKEISEIQNSDSTFCAIGAVYSQVTLLCHQIIIISYRMLEESLEYLANCLFLKKNLIGSERY